MTITLALLAALLCGSAFARTLRPTAFAATNKAPTVSKQPSNKTVLEGEPVTFESTGAGTPTPTEQWELSTDGGVTWSEIASATSTQYTIASTTTSESGHQFRAKYKNVAGEITSKAATLTVNAPPQVTQQPVSVTVEEGENAVFEAAASGVPAPTLQWQVSANGGLSWANISGETANRLTLTAVKTTLNGHQYRALFKSSAVREPVHSEAATLTVTKAPSVTKQPVSVTVDEGEAATFEATGSGTPTPTVQWELSTDGGATWAPVENATSTTFSIESTNVAEDGNEYRAVFTNSTNKPATSNAATLTVHAPPVVTLEPDNTTVEAGEAAVFEVAAGGHPTPTVQWETSTNSGGTWSAIAGANTDTLTIEKAQLSENAREFRAVFTNVAGKVTSNTATLTVATNHYTAVAWGYNQFRQLGNGSANILSAVPVQVSGLRFVTAVAGGGSHSMALLADGRVMTWGYNAYGQLGNGGSEGVSEVPVEATGISTAVAIAAGRDHSLALLKNGTVMAWGDNESGQLGTGTGTESEKNLTPAPVKGLSGVKAIAAGEYHSLALLNNGTVMAWGADENGQLGNGKLTNATLPSAVKGLTGVTSIAGGSTFSLALTSKGAIEGWGSNTYGQLANSEVEEGVTDVPVSVGSLTGVTAIAAGANHALALVGGGAVMAWGQDADGELGNGVVKAREETPVAVSGLSGATAISAGNQDSVALLSSGSVMSWGANNDGQLGDGVSGGISSVPVQVSGLAKAASVAAGSAHMLAYGEPIPAVTGVSPAVGPASGATTVTISGANLNGATKVSFGSAEAAGYTVTSPTSITATSPAGSGTVDVVVTTVGGSSAKSAADRYTFQAPPTITKLAPKLGPAAGHNTVTITGTEFTAASAVAFGTTAALNYTVVSPTLITAEAPAEAPALVHITVTNPDSTSAATTASAYKFTPTVESVSPSTGSKAGGEPVTVTGTGFALGTATSFKFGTLKATAVECTSATTCTMTTPAHEVGTVNVIATVNKITSPLATGDKFTFS